MKTLRSDLVPGFATGLFSIPEGMVYAKLAEVNPVFGLGSGMIATTVASLTTGFILMISTLTSAISLPRPVSSRLPAFSTARCPRRCLQSGNLLLAGVESRVMQELERQRFA